MKNTEGLFEADEITAILEEDRLRLKLFTDVPDQVTGEGVGEDRLLVKIPDHDIPRQWVPEEVLSEPAYKVVMEAGSVAELLRQNGMQPQGSDHHRFCRLLRVVRMRHDPAFAFATVFHIKDKTTGALKPFILNYAQRVLLGEFERMRRAGEPIRLVLLKARQWGGSTLTQLYMAWIQLFVKEGWNSLIVAQTKDTARRIKAMYSKVLMHFPNEVFRVGQLRFSPVERSAADSCITDSRGRPLRSNVITVSSFENYESTRGSDIAMAHFSEVAYWRTTPQKSAGGLIRAVSSGIAEGVACTMEVMESTANGKSGYFYDEYQEAKLGHSARKALFIPFFFIEHDRLPFASEQEREEFARYLLEHRNDTVAGEKTAEPGAYLWQLWEKGATLSHIRWYVSRRRSFHSHAQMASEAPSDDVECFTFSGHLMISPETVMKVERQERRMPLFTGHLQGSGDERRLRKEENGPLRIWVYPDEHLRTQNRYMVVVDVGGRSESSDFSVITVIDRLYADVEGLPLFNCLPADGRMAPGLHVVARWRGHLRYDLMADMAVELAGWYDQALLVFESNTFDKKRAEASEFVDEGDHILGILDGVRNRYRNVYMRSSSMSEDLKERKVSKVGFQTNRRTKQQMVDRFTVMFEDGLFHDPDERFYKELSIYEQRPDGSYGNIVGAGNHDDIVMTDMIAALVHQQQPRATLDSPPRHPRASRPATINESWF